MNDPNDAQRFGSDAVFRDTPSDEDGTDPLALFESEADLLDRQSGGATYQVPETRDVLPNTPRAVPLVAPVSAGVTQRLGLIALDRALDRLGHVAWPEAVAIIEALCTALTTSGGERAPEMSSVSITAVGTVTVGARGAMGAAAPVLARMLHTLAEAGATPAPLRLFVTKWVSAGEGHSIADFSKDLAYFARPDGPALIQAVYERAIAAPPKTRPEAAPAPPQLDRPQAPRRRRSYAVAAAIMVLGAALTILFAWRGVSVTSRQASAAVGAGAGTTVPDTTDPTAPGPSAQDGSLLAPASASGSARTAAASSAPRGAALRAGAPSAPVSSAVRASLGSAAAPPSRSITSPLASAEESSRATVLADPAGTRRRGDGPVSPIYSSADPDVMPPVFQHPQLPAQLLSGMRPDMNTMELIVSEAGTVERVRLLSTPKRMADMMLLSGAKNWEFGPALRDGQSVRYRLELSWAATP